METDPFEHGVLIKPFCAGFYDGHVYKPFWSLECVDQLFAFLADYPDPLLLYVHNGGRFDFFYCMKYLSAAHMRIVNNRIVTATFMHHELRDSFAIMPFALADYQKTVIDYGTFTSDKREANREAIISYLRDDCTDLYSLCTTFHEEFGDRITVGSASMQEFKRLHTFDHGDQDFDRIFREHFYYGGRCQCFATGIIPGRWKIYDINSQYPFSMKTFLHPVSAGILKGLDINDPQTCFVDCEGRNDGAFPSRDRNGGLDFTVPYGRFYPSIHEFRAAVETGCFTLRAIHQTIGFERTETFAEFVDHFYDARNLAKANGDKIRALFYKYILNSCYGKFAQNPENYSEFYLTHESELPPDFHQCSKACPDDCRKKWVPSYMCEEWIIWKRPLQRLSYFNIATGASITGAARSLLLRGLAASIHPAYCDTDSIICEDLQGVRIDDTELGAWKCEASGDTLAIAGKKLYCLRSENSYIKKAHKGAKLSGPEVFKIASGQTIEYPNPVPTFSWDGSHRFITRKVRSTTKSPKPFRPL